MKSGDEPKSFPWDSCMLAVGFLLQFLAFLLSSLAFFSPFWYIELNTDIQAGLWGRCDRDLECIWFHERNYAWEHSLPSWYVAAQVMFAIGIGILAISVLLAIGYLMFGCCKCKAVRAEIWPMVFGVLITVAMVFETFSIGIYGTGAYHVFECSINSWVARFQWAFYVGIAALFNCLFAALVYLYAGYSIREAYLHYDPFSMSYAG